MSDQIEVSDTYPNPKTTKKKENTTKQPEEEVRAAPSLSFLVMHLQSSHASTSG